MRKAASFGGLLRARIGEFLRRGCRPNAPVGASAASISLRLLMLGGALLLAIGSLSATQAYGASKPAPDPYPSPTTAPQAPAPDPYPSREVSTPSIAPTPAPVPEPAPVASAPRSSSSEAVEQQPTKTTPQKQEPERRADRTRKRVKTRAITPLAIVEKKSKPIAAPAVAAVAASTSGRPLALGGLALLALVAASGSLLIHLARADRWETKL